MAVLSYAVAVGVPAAAIVLGMWTLRRHDRVYPSKRAIDAGRSRRRFDAGAWLWRNGS